MFPVVLLDEQITPDTFLSTACTSEGAEAVQCAVFVASVERVNAEQKEQRKSLVASVTVERRNE